MKTPLRKKWARFVLRYSGSPVWPYFCLSLTLGLVALQFTKYAHVHFLLIMVVVTLMAYERWAFAELLAERKGQFEEPGGEKDARSSSKPRNQG